MASALSRAATKLGYSTLLPPARKSSQGICAGKGRVCVPSNWQREVTLLLPSFRRVVREPAEEYRRGG